MTDTGDLIETEIERTITEVLPKAHEKHRQGRLSALRWALSILPPASPESEELALANWLEKMANGQMPIDTDALLSAAAHLRLNEATP